MTRMLLVLALGAAAGYVYGYRDAKVHDKMVIERVIDRAGGAARGKYDPNVDRATDTFER